MGITESGAGRSLDQGSRAASPGIDVHDDRATVRAEPLFAESDEEHRERAWPLHEWDAELEGVPRVPFGPDQVATVRISDGTLKMTALPSFIQGFETPRSKAPTARVGRGSDPDLRSAKRRVTPLRGSAPATVRAAPDRESLRARARERVSMRALTDRRAVTDTALVRAPGPIGSSLGRMYAAVRGWLVRLVRRDD